MRYVIMTRLVLAIATLLLLSAAIFGLIQSR